MIRRMARFAVRKLRALAQEQEPDRSDFLRRGQTDISAFSEKVERYRSRGVQIGEKVRMLGDIDGVNPHLVSVGSFSVVGRDSMILAHCPIKGARGVSIGQFVYIGYGAIIMPGVEVGDHCIVGAGSVVTKSAPAGSILAGNPARVVRQVTPEEQKRIEEMMRAEQLFGWDSNRQT